MSSFVAPSLASWAPTGQQAVPAPEPEPKPETPPPTPAPMQGAFRVVILRDTTATHDLARLQITNGDCTWTIERSRQDTYNLARAMSGESTPWPFELYGVNCLMVPHFRKYVRCLLANKGVHMGWAMWAAELINKKQVRPHSLEWKIRV